MKCHFKICFFKLLLLLNVEKQLNNWKRLLMLSHFLLVLYNKSSMCSLSSGTSKEREKEKSFCCLGFIGRCTFNLKYERKAQKRRKLLKSNYRQIYAHIFSSSGIFTIKTEIIIWSLWPELLEKSEWENILIGLNWVLHVHLAIVFDFNSFNWRNLIAKRF